MTDAGAGGNGHRPDATKRALGYRLLGYYAKKAAKLYAEDLAADPQAVDNLAREVAALRDFLEVAGFGEDFLASNDLSVRILREFAQRIRQWWAEGQG